MNILRIVADKREPSPALKKLQAQCKDKDANASRIRFDRDELKERLEPLQYHVTQEKGTERAFSGKYVHMNEYGVFTCVVCQQQLFHSDTKYDSKSGWPSFQEVISRGRVIVCPDTSHGVQRLEAKCSKCGSHLGHVFDDGPKPTGIRYCVNSASLDFRKHTIV